MKEKANEKVQMPPIVPLRIDLGQVLNVDKDIIGHDNTKFVFTDITFGISDKVISYYYYYIIIIYLRGISPEKVTKQ